MKATTWGRIVFGASAVLFGIIALLWHDADTWQTLSIIWKIPFGTVVGAILMVAQIAGGIGIQFPRTARLASVVLLVVFSLFSLACVPGIIAAPRIYQEYGSFFEQFALLCAALAMYAATDSNAAQSNALTGAAQIGLGVCALSYALDQLFYLRETASLVPVWIPPAQMFWAALTTIAFALAAVAMLVNLQAVLAIRLMTLMLVLFGILVWVPRLIAHSEAHGNWSEFALNFLIAGASWVVAETVSRLRLTALFHPAREET